MNGAACLRCHTWGPLDQAGHHQGCQVVMMEPCESDRFPMGSRPGSYPAVCPCECRDCVRAWWEAERPIVRDGKILLAGGRP
jgi:hypothetical protein